MKLDAILDPTAVGFLARLCAGLLSLAVSMLCCPRAGADKDPACLSFGVVADVQYADQDSLRKRHYREALARLQDCVADLNTRDLAFTVQVGDIIDRGAESFDRVLPVYNQLAMPKYHVLGNHDFPLPRAEVLAKLGMDRPYYAFSHSGWRFVVLDAQDLGVGYGWPENSENYRRGAQMLERLRQEEAVNAESWNGGIGPEQKSWLQQTLREAAGKGEKSIIFCHMPLLAAACTPIHLLWNHEEIVAVLESSASAVLVLSGHDHGGGYAQRKGIHYVTVQGMVEAPVQNAYAIVDLYGDTIEIRGVGAVPDRVLTISPREDTQPSEP
jgi:manganese-dependent ADP-ribose/CDP-alcohol diphosphatase